MAKPLLTTRPLRLDPAYVRRRVRLAVALIPLVLPGVVLLGEALGHGAGVDLALGALVLALGALPAVALALDLQARRDIAADFLELHAPITKRQEIVANGHPTGRIQYTYALPDVPSAGIRAKERAVTWKIEEGSPLYADPRGDTMVVLVSKRHRNHVLAPRMDLWPLLLPEDAARDLRHRLVSVGIPVTSGRGFPHPEVVGAALRGLLEAEAEGRLPARPEDHWEPGDVYDPEDPVLSVQHLARDIATAYGFSPGPILVTFRDHLEAAGQVEWEPSGDLYVEVRRELARQPELLTAVLAHEVAHLFLAHHGVHFADRFENEVATDLAAVLWGFGPVMLASYQNELKRQGDRIVTTGWQRVVTELGYTTPEERAYVLHKVAGRHALPKDLRRRLTRPQRQAEAAGRARALAEAGVPPLKAAPLHAELGFLLARLWRTRIAPSKNGTAPAEPPPPGDYRIADGKVAFRCPRCTQAMRLPLGKRGNASCPTCRVALPFHS